MATKHTAHDEWADEMRELQVAVREELGGRVVSREETTALVKGDAETRRHPPVT